MRLRDLCLVENPFPPSGTGLELRPQESGYFPGSTITKLVENIKKLRTNPTEKTFSVIGDYGTGKTSFLNNAVKEELTSHNYKVFNFQNPGVQLYDLANTLLRGIGRVEFAKGLFELVRVGLIGGTFHQYLSVDEQKDALSFSGWIEQAKDKEKRRKMIQKLQFAIRNSNYNFTDDDEIANKLARLIIETRERSYFDYRDFVSGKGSYVAEKEEPKYFRALIKVLKELYNCDGIAFVIDEFEDVIAHSRMPVFKQADYLRTLRHLIDLSKEEAFWLVVAMTPRSVGDLEQNEPALYQRLGPDSPYSIFLGDLNEKDINGIIRFYINIRGRDEKCDQKHSGLFPFPENFGEIIKETNSDLTLHQIIKLAHFLIAMAISEENVKIPLNRTYIASTIEEVYPGKVRYE